MNEKQYVYGYGYRYEVKFEGDDDEVNKCLQDGYTMIRVSHSDVQLMRYPAFMFSWSTVTN